MARCRTCCPAGSWQSFETRRESLLRADVPEELATRVAVLPPAYAVLTIVEVADRDGGGPRSR